MNRCLVFFNKGIDALYIRVFLQEMIVQQIHLAVNNGINQSRRVQQCAMMSR